jgi:hypothetical protein
MRLARSANSTQAAAVYHTCSTVSSIGVIVGQAEK